MVFLVLACCFFPSLLHSCDWMNDTHTIANWFQMHPHAHSHSHSHAMHNAMHMQQTHSICMVMHMCETILIFNTYQNCAMENNVWLEFVANEHTHTSERTHVPWCALMHPNEIWKFCVRLRVFQNFFKVPYNVVLHILSRYQVFINFDVCSSLLPMPFAIARLNRSFTRSMPLSPSFKCQ